MFSLKLWHQQPALWQSSKMKMYQMWKTLAWCLNRNKYFKCKKPSMISSLSASVVLSSANTKSSALKINIMVSFAWQRLLWMLNVTKQRLVLFQWLSYLQIQSTYPVNSFSSFCCSFKAMNPARDSTLSFSFANSLQTIFVKRKYFNGFVETIPNVGPPISLPDLLSHCGVLSLSLRLKFWQIVVFALNLNGTNWCGISFQTLARHFFNIHLHSWSCTTGGPFSFTAN